MAGAKETPRQKLIALMYLVFITMLALNVSKEVLDGFGQMFKKIASANDRVDQSNDIYYNNFNSCCSVFIVGCSISLQRVNKTRKRG